MFEKNELGMYGTDAELQAAISTSPHATTPHATNPHRRLGGLAEENVGETAAEDTCHSQHGEHLRHVAKYHELSRGTRQGKM